MRPGRVRFNHQGTISRISYIRDIDRFRRVRRGSVCSGAAGPRSGAGVAGTWRHDPALSGGGQLNDSGSHHAGRLSRDRLAVKRCSAFSTTSAQVDINRAFTIEFEGGAQGSVSVVGNGPGWYEDITIWSRRARSTCERKLEVSDGAWASAHFRRQEEMPKGGNPDDNFIAAILGKAQVGCPAILGSPCD